MSDHRYAVIEMLASSGAELRERIQLLEADIVTYRELARAGIEALRERTVECDRLRVQHRRVVEEYRHLRALIMRPGPKALTSSTHCSYAGQ